MYFFYYSFYVSQQSLRPITEWFQVKPVQDSSVAWLAIDKIPPWQLEFWLPFESVLHSSTLICPYIVLKLFLLYPVFIKTRLILSSSSSLDDKILNARLIKVRFTFVLYLSGHLLLPYSHHPLSVGFLYTFLMNLSPLADTFTSRKGNFELPLLYVNFNIEFSTILVSSKMISFSSRTSMNMSST